MSSFSRSSHRSHYPSDIEANGTPLENMPRTSTETQRRNGFVQSTAKDRSVRIQEDIQSGHYNCSICADAIAQNVASRPNNYSCGECYAVFHFSCIDSWAARSRTASRILSSPPWKCPMCQHETQNMPRPSCWCGKDANVDKCNSICSKDETCHHGNVLTCTKQCHPGPCENSCGLACRDLPVRSTTAWQRMKYRCRNPPAGLGKSIALFGGILLLCYIPVVIYFPLYIMWHGMPYRYPDFDMGFWEVILFLGTLALTAGLGVVNVNLFAQTETYFAHIFNLGDPSSRTTNGTRVKRFFLVIILGAIGLALAVLPFLSLLFGPEILIKGQMKHSCDGFDQRIRLGGYAGTSKTVLHSHSVNGWKLQDPLYLGTHFAPYLENNLSPFQWVHRLTGKSIEGNHIGVDVDTRNGYWKLYHLSSEDISNQWVAEGSKKATKHSSPELPTFHEMNATVVAKGSFGDTDKASQHIYLNVSGLDMWIANHWQFRDKYNQQPYLRVFNTTGMEPPAITKLLATKWSPKKDTERLLMRTATFDFGIGEIEMCVREEDRSKGLRMGQNPYPPGMREELFVPLALIQALRTQHTFRAEDPRKRGRESE